MTEAEKRAEAAQRILQDPLFKEAFDGLEANIVNSLTIVAVSDVEAQHELVLMLQLAKTVKARIESHILTGELEKQAPTIIDSFRAKVASLVKK